MNENNEKSNENNESNEAWIARAHEAGTVAGLLCEFRDWWGYAEPSDAEMGVRVQRLIESSEAEFLLAGERARPPACASCATASASGSARPTAGSRTCSCASLPAAGAWAARWQRRRSRAPASAAHGASSWT